MDLVTRQHAQHIWHIGPKKHVSKRWKVNLTILAVYTRSQRIAPQRPILFSIVKRISGLIWLICWAEILFARSDLQPYGPPTHQLILYLRGKKGGRISHDGILSTMLPIWIKIDAVSDKRLIINSPFSLLYRNIWTPTNVSSLRTTLPAYYPAVQLSGKIATFILLICNDVMHPSPGSRWLGNNGIVQLQAWQTMLPLSLWYTGLDRSHARWRLRKRAPTLPLAWS